MTTNTNAAQVANNLIAVAEDQAFEAWYKQDCLVGGVNARIAARAAWNARAALTTAAAVPAGEYPPLPEPYHVAYDDIDKEDVKCFAEGQLRAYVDADRAMRAQAAPAAVAGPSDAVAYIDIGAGGYLDLGSDLSDEALRKLPKGRHMLAIVGTYGVDGYAPVAAPTTQPEQVAQGDALPRDDFAWLVVQEACETEPADEDDPECIRILRRDLKSAVLAAFLRDDAARAQAKEGA